METFNIGDIVFFGKPDQKNNMYGKGEILRINTSLGGQTQYIVQWENRGTSPHLGQYLRLVIGHQNVSANERIKVLMPDNEEDLSMTEFLACAQKRETICQDIRKLEEQLRILNDQKEFNRRTVLYSGLEGSVCCETRDKNVVIVQKTLEGVTHTITVTPSAFEIMIRKMKDV